MIGELSKVADVGLNTKIDTPNDMVDISKRIDADRNDVISQKEEFDIGKRIQPNDIEKTRVFEGEGHKEYEGKLSEQQKQELIDKGISPGILKDCSYEEGKVYIDTTNSSLVGEKHPETGVKFVRREIELKDIMVVGVFPEFISKFTVQLPDSLLKASDSEQFTECNKQLKSAIAENPKLKDQFSERQLLQINAGLKPGGCTWHHNETPGKMELVDTKIHEVTRHTGGKAIWGGGSTMR